MSLRFLKLFSQPSQAKKLEMCINSANFNAFSLIESPPTCRFCSLACFGHMSSPSSRSEYLAGFSFLHFNGIPALMAASIASFLLRNPFNVVLLTSMLYFLLISLASFDWFGSFYAVSMISIFSSNLKSVLLCFMMTFLGKIWKIATSKFYFCTLFYSIVSKTDSFVKSHCSVLT